MLRGVLARVLPVDLDDEVLRQTGRQNARARQLLPRVAVSCIMALTLYAHASYEAVLWKLGEGAYAGCAGTGWPWAWSASRRLAQARGRLGEAPLRELFRRVARSLAASGTPGAWYRQWRLASFDGTTLALADLPAVEHHFGRSVAARDQRLSPVALAGVAGNRHPRLPRHGRDHSPQPSLPRRFSP
ncbi:MAG TPA: transposase domain-containing protein [Azospirillaceae bacterium]|nr:transposase domain-containing protein [Azospirillaceae bacterium]